MADADAAAESSVRNLFIEFLQDFRDDSDDGSSPLAKYEVQIIDMLNAGRTTLFIDYTNLSAWQEADLAGAVTNNYYRFDPYLRQALLEVVRRVKQKVADFERNEKLRVSQSQSDGADMEGTFEPPSIDAAEVVEEDQVTYFVAFLKLPHQFKIRDMKTGTIGKMISLCGTVTRSSEVRPELLFASFTCSACGTRHPSVDQQFQYTEPHICSNSQCSKRDFQLIVSECNFVDWQRLRVQENADEIPAGSMPRCIDVICRNEVVEIAKAGDKILFTGFAAVIPDVAKLGENTTGMKSTSGRGDSAVEGVRGLKSMGVRDYSYKMVFVASTVQVHGQNSSVGMNLNDLRGVEMTSDQLDMSDEDQQMIIGIRNTPLLYSKMAESICPTVHGHSEVKRGILLQMLGGVHKVTHEGINLRGDINVCIVGDPSCAKSQFLKYVHGFLPRSIYTSGKSSSAAGLTASVVRDSETGEYCIEAGALMLADNGIWYVF
jgi:DNA replication licensing factor MCM6